MLITSSEPEQIGFLMRFVWAVLLRGRKQESELKHCQGRLFENFNVHVRKQKCFRNLKKIVSDSYHTTVGAIKPRKSLPFRSLLVLVCYKKLRKQRYSCRYGKSTLTTRSKE